MGLRSLFGKGPRVTAKDGETKPNMASPVEPRPAGGIRSSIADMSYWPHTLQSSRSEAQLAAVRPSASNSSTTKPPSALPPLPNPKGYIVDGKGRPIDATLPKATRKNIGYWEPPPLFQAYPQALRHIHLPAPVTSADAIIKLNNRRGSDLGVLEELNHDTVIGELDDKMPDGMDQDSKSKSRRHRRVPSSSGVKADWTTKIFVLVTSGYLLQYHGEGQFDRLPEKILQLTKASAAFASDSIPGRHWVLQVCSAMELDGTPASESRSFFSRMAFRSDKRHASNFLMVFDEADDMDAWIALLRREIEALGGKKKLSETGRPTEEVAATNSGSLRPQASQRTLVVRDPTRFSRALSCENLSWHQERDNDGQQPDTPNDQLFDDVSTTTSVVSQDGRQLDSLRDKGNRSSFLSSGQRTVITSAGSSPVASPIHEGFHYDKDESHLPVVNKFLPPEPRLRPNASVISERRQSLQPLNCLTEIRQIQSSSRPQSTAPDVNYPPSPLQPQLIPNFSVPQSSSRRFSFVRSPIMEGRTQLPPPPLYAPDPLLKDVHKALPTALPMTRSLPVTTDQSSHDFQTYALPDSVVEPGISEHISTPQSFNTTKEHEKSMEQQPVYPVRRSSFVPPRDINPNLVKRSSGCLPSMQSPGNSEMMPKSAPDSRLHYLRQPLAPPRARPVQPSYDNDELMRSRTSLDSYRLLNRSPIPPPLHKPNRASMVPTFSIRSSHARLMDTSTDTSVQNLPEETLMENSLKHTIQTRHISSIGQYLPKSQHLLHPKGTKSIHSCRSLPQLTGGPPPAPPPNCALPPIPQKQTPQTASPHWKPLRI